jgi:lipoyl-dependent peroxiredoxin
MKTMYETSATSSGDGRNGTVTSEHGELNTPMSMPAAMGGKDGGLNPEILFAAGWSACFHSALRMVARNQQVTVDGSQVKISITLGQTDQGAFRLAAAIDAFLPGLTPNLANTLVTAAHQTCPYSAAVANNVPTAISVRT